MPFGNRFSRTPRLFDLVSGFRDGAVDIYLILRKMTRRNLQSAQTYNLLRYLKILKIIRKPRSAISSPLGILRAKWKSIIQKE